MAGIVLLVSKGKLTEQNWEADREEQAQGGEAAGSMSCRAGDVTSLTFAFPGRLSHPPGVCYQLGSVLL